MFPVNPDTRTDTDDINDEGRAVEGWWNLELINTIAELENILQSNLPSRKSSLQESRLSCASHSPGPYSDLLSLTKIKSSSLVIGVVGKALSVDNERKLWEILIETLALIWMIFQENQREKEGKNRERQSSK